MLLTMFAAGSVLGAIAALLLAPKPGSETRRAIASTSRNAYGRKEMVIDPAKKATSGVKGLKEKMSKEKMAGPEAAGSVEEAA